MTGFVGTAFDGRGHMGSSPNEGPFLAPQIVPCPYKADPKREPNLEHSPYAVAVLPAGTGMKRREAGCACGGGPALGVAVVVVFSSSSCSLASLRLRSSWSSWQSLLSFLTLI